MAAQYLEEAGFKIIQRNWRNRWAEIDIVAIRSGVTHFIEVKYRKTATHGSGFDYITADKQQRLRRAAMMWMSDKAEDYQIDVIAVSGSAKPENLEYLPNAVSG